MKVSGTGGASPAGGGKTPRAGGEGFRLVGAQAPAAPAPPSSVAGASGVMGLSALIALQDVGSPLDRRRRSVRRAEQILDILDGVKLALLGGHLGPADLENLRRAVREERAATDDPRLEDVLNEIEVRAEVELAKLETTPRAA